MNYLALVVVVIIIVVEVWCCMVSNQRMFEDVFEGVWVAKADEYCAAADIDAMMLTIGPPYSHTSINPWAQVTRPAHLLIMDNKHNGSFDLKYKLGSAWVFSRSYEIRAAIIPSDLDVGDSPVWSSVVRITIDVPRGRMVIVDADGEIAAILFRDNAITSACLTSD
jgi:hypothetical protein